MKPWLASVPLTLVLMACAAEPTAVQPPAAPTVTLALPKSTYALLDTFTFTASVHDTSAYLYLYVVDAAGQIVQLLPNRSDSPAQARSEVPVHVEAGQTVSIFPAGGRYSLVITDPVGSYTLVGFASIKPLNLNALRAYPTDSDTFAQMNISGLGDLSAGLKAAADAQPDNRYAQTTAGFTVVKKTF